MERDPHTIIADTLSGDILEVGPGHAPFPVPSGANISYVDRPSQGGRDLNFPELIGVPRGPDADYQFDLDEGMGGIADRSFDAVICSHVIEHVSNPIAAMQEFERILRPDGRLVLVVPDRRLTFDSGRAPTPFRYLLSKWKNKVRATTDEEIKEFCAAIYEQPPFLPPHVREWHNPAGLNAEMLALHRRRSIHVHCWNPGEFAEFIAGIISEGLGRWKLEHLYLASRFRPIEFGLVLGKGGDAGRAGAEQLRNDWLAMSGG